MLCNSTTGFVFCVYLTYSSPMCCDLPVFFMTSISNPSLPPARLSFGGLIGTVLRPFTAPVDPVGHLAGAVCPAVWLTSHQRGTRRMSGAIQHDRRVIDPQQVSASLTPTRMRPCFACGCIVSAVMKRSGLLNGTVFRFPGFLLRFVRFDAPWRKTVSVRFLNGPFDKVKHDLEVFRSIEARVVVIRAL